MFIRLHVIMFPQLKKVLVYIFLIIPQITWGWKRSALIYHLSGRSDAAWRRNFMRVDEAGQFTGQWLFDHFILTSELENKKAMYGNLTGQDFLDLLENMEKDVNQLNSALQSLNSYPLPNGAKIEFSIGVPYIDNQDRLVYVEGKSYRLSNPSERSSLASWYLNKVKTIFNRGYQRLQLRGIYYHREDIVEVYGDVAFVQFLNREAHSLNLKSVWVPYYDAPYAWEGKTLGFDELIIQPRYSFLSSIDKGSMKGDRLYGTGRLANERGISYEYELRGGGEAQIENWIAHQYLAVAQATGASNYAQVFFVGDRFFDLIERRDDKSTPGDKWWAYSDLCNYLRGEMISNLEVGISFSVGGNMAGPNVLATSWIVPSGYGGLSSIRLDFRDFPGENYFRGRLTVSKSGEIAQAYGQRLGIDELNPNYNAIFVPLANLNWTEGQSLTIRLEKEDEVASWPEIFQLIAAKYEPSFIANPILGESSSATVSVIRGPYEDINEGSSKGYATGKLTDGAISSSNYPWEEKVMGWMLLEGHFTINLDLQQNFEDVKQIKIWTHVDQGAGVRLPNKLTALISSSCQPQISGILTGGQGSSCGATATSGRVQVEKGSSPPDGYILTLDIPAGSRGRYVTVSGVALAWFLLDEVQVLDSRGNILSGGKPYRVSPIPGEQGSNSNYPDDNRKLVDGAIFRYFFWGLGNIVGFDRGTEGQIETSWVASKEVKCVRIWLTESNGAFGVVLPQQVGIQVRSVSGVWGNVRNVETAENCGPAPCAALCFPNVMRINGIRAVFKNLEGWAMITEMSTE